MSLRFGIIGQSPGNGHPYSWSAICNGYRPDAMALCGFPAIPDYLARQQWPHDRLPGARVTHVWAQDRKTAARIALAGRIETVVARPEDMIGHIDALLLARDDARNHRHFAAPFLRAGLPVYIDKPIALSMDELDALNMMQLRPGQIFSCSALRFAPEMRLDAETAAGIGPIRLITGMTAGSWQTYAIHLVDPLLAMLGHDTAPRLLFSAPAGHDGRTLALRFPDGPDVHLTAAGTEAQPPISLRITGLHGETTLTFSDSFGAFRTALAEFAAAVREGRSRLPEAFNRRAVSIIEMGLP
ncbi:hypothetical protein DQW77_10825 [Roseovarius sp. TE539]|uniref:Gfo/Idh/MocA family oxidoreductase n=1 Tax=Roseovarius sp. TE539 TaxID=2249812 RepID=UPI000DE11DBC|nr:Gfo/Idh/MocA family oxidoreductase [Roseovarius sp. TE539]RBI72252.1 hypothetical protein DQW77_10825 [Roseovarius sp. TE539]